MRAFRSVVLAAASVLAMPVAVGVSLVPVAAAAQQVPVIRVGQTLTGVFDGSEPMFDNQYLLRGYELNLRRGETVTVSLSSRDVIAIPLVIGPNDFNALPEDGSLETVTFTAPAAGAYTIAVLGTEASRGTFTISVRSGGQAAVAPSPPPPAARPSPPPASRPNASAGRGQSTTTMTISSAWTAADDRLSSSEHVDQYRLNLRRGDRVVVRVESGNLVHVVAATGPGDFAQTSDFATQTTVEFTVPAAGEYVIGLAPDEPNATGSYRIVITITGQ